MDSGTVSGSISPASSPASGEDRPNQGLLSGLQMLQLFDYGSASQQRRSLEISADTALRASAGLWFLVAVIGQWMFAVYIVSFYGRAVVEDDLARWSKGLSRGYIPGDNIGNLALAMHLPQPH